jgi:hypothetical protein
VQNHLALEMLVRAGADERSAELRARQARRRLACAEADVQVVPNHRSTVVRRAHRSANSCRRWHQQQRRLEAGRAIGLRDSPAGSLVAHMHVWLRGNIPRRTARRWRASATASATLR